MSPPSRGTATAWRPSSFRRANDGRGQPVFLGTGKSRGDSACAAGGQVARTPPAAAREPG
jgi:hypothetical protein